MIPEQYKDFRFCRVRYKTKKPFELDWTNKPYSYEEISQHFPKENYGIMTGINGLAVLDDDTKVQQLLKLALDSFGETHRVRNHLYYKLLNWDGQKIIFFDKDKNHLGELQGKGQMIVGAGSIHPSGEVYELKADIPIKEIDVDIFKAVFEDYIPEVKTEIVRDYKKTDWAGDDIKDIPITNIISLGGFKTLSGGRYLGIHPVHGATNGGNLLVDTSRNSWVCFRCNKKNHRGCGGASEMIAVIEGIKRCDEVGAHCFTEEEGREVIKIAREKYGLRVPEVQVTIQKPMGWACSIDIKRMAERFNLLNCPKCNVPFLFKEDLGFYKCPACKMFGGLKRFALMCYQNKLQEQTQ